MTHIDLEIPDHAYTFGFLQADGHLAQGVGNKGRLTVEVSLRDCAILEAFQRLFSVNSTISYRTRATNFSVESKTAIWSVCAREFREELQALGLPAGRKSAIVGPPQGAYSARDYLRGLIDADGAVGRTGQDLPFVSFATASDKLAEFLREYAHRLTGADRTLRRNKRDSIYNILYTREEAVELARDLYYSGCLALPRKLDASRHASSWVRPPDFKKASVKQRWTAEQDQILLSALTADEAATLLNRTAQSCAMRRWRLLGPNKARVRFPRTLA